MKILTEKAETYTILRGAGKSVRDAYKLAGYKGDMKGSTPYQLEKRIRTYSLTDPKLMKISQDVIERILKIAKKTLKDRRNDKDIQTLCVKSSLQIIQDQQDRVDPKKNINMNANVDVSTDGLIDFSMYFNNPLNKAEVQGAEGVVVDVY